MFPRWRLCLCGKLPLQPLLTSHSVSVTNLCRPHEHLSSSSSSKCVSLPPLPPLPPLPLSNLPPFLAACLLVSLCGGRGEGRRCDAAILQPRDEAARGVTLRRRRGEESARMCERNECERRFFSGQIRRSACPQKWEWKKEIVSLFFSCVCDVCVCISQRILSCGPRVVPPLDYFSAVTLTTADSEGAGESGARDIEKDERESGAWQVLTHRLARCHFFLFFFSRFICREVV